MLVKLFNIKYDTDGQRVETPLTVVVSIDECENDPIQPDEILQLALDAHARDSDWLIAECEFAVL